MLWNLDEAIAYYGRQGAPGDQNALISLLKEVQREQGGEISMDAFLKIKESYGLKESFLSAVIRRIPGLRLVDTHCLELCAGPNCGKARELAVFAEKLRGKSAEKITVKYVPCMRLCGKGPNVKWDGKLYHQADAELLCRLTGGKQS